MQDFAVLLATVAALALTVTKITDFVRNAFDKDDSWPKWSWNVVPLAIGLLFALGWQLNVAVDAARLVPAAADQAERLSGVTGQILTGIVIGMGAGAWHEVLDSLSSIANRNNSTVESTLTD